MQQRVLNPSLLHLACFTLAFSMGCASKSAKLPVEKNEAASPSSSSSDFAVTLKDSSGNPIPAKTAGATKERVPLNPSDTETQQQAESMKSAVASAVEKAEANHERVTGADSGATDRTVVAVSTPPPKARTPGVASEQALKWLKNGNRRFVRGHFRNDGVSAKDRARTAELQKPHAVILTSTDSRLSPELIFDQKLGEVFVLRMVDAKLDAQVQAAVQEGVEQLGANLVIVLGVNSAGNWENPRAFAQELTETSEILRRGVASGGVKVVPALYNLRTGAVIFAE